MRSFCFKELLLVSFKEKKARRIAFHPKATIVRGDNETGKSSLLKSIFITFGAEPTKLHPSWSAADVRSVVRFEVDGKAFSMLRHGSTYAAFDGRDRLLGRFQSVTNELAPFLAKIFGFGLRLPNRQGEFIALPPAYFFLPYYMDQDGSWVNQWTGFNRLDQFANWKKGLIEYHAGIRGNRYYEAQAAKLDAEAALAKVQRKREGLREVYDGLSERFAEAQFSVDFSAYHAEIDELLRRCERLRQREERFKASLLDLRTARDRTKTQLDITNHAREEARRDYEFALEPNQAEDVHCPTCGAGYSNSFAERFAIAVDEDQCADMALQLAAELASIDKKIAEEIQAARNTAGEIAEIEKLLARKEGEVALGDIIRQEGRRELREVMSSDLGSLEREEGRFHVEIDQRTKAMKALDSKEHRKEVNQFFAARMQVLLFRLDAEGVGDDAVERVDARVATTGSELPRALLAYKLAFLDVVRKYGSVASGPLVIDSPNQQDQDDSHLERILQLLRDERPDGTQLILGLVESKSIDFGGSEVVLDEKYNVLRESEFQEVGAAVTSLIEIALG